MKTRRFASLRAYVAAAKKPHYEVAADLGISHAQLSKYMRGLAMPRAELALRLSEQTGVPVAAMVRAKAKAA